MAFCSEADDKYIKKKKTVFLGDEIEWFFNTLMISLLCTLIPKMAVMGLHNFLLHSEDAKKIPTHMGIARYSLLNYPGMALWGGK